jgi:ribosomal protein S18 acetylase RimI-like enzyme
MAVELRPMREDEFQEWLPRLRDGYADSMVEHAEMSEQAARAKAEADTKLLFPEEKPAPEQAVHVVEADGEPVGVLWVAEREVDGVQVLWIFEIRIDERFRGRGYGRAAMLLAEDDARSRGIERIALNVFGGNEVARNLYRSLGYAETAVMMSKPVSQPE